MADQGDQIAMAAGFDANDAKAVFGVVVRDALDQPDEYLPIGLHVHAAHRACPNQCCHSADAVPQRSGGPDVFKRGPHLKLMPPHVCKAGAAELR